MTGPADGAKSESIKNDTGSTDKDDDSNFQAVLHPDTATSSSSQVREEEPTSVAVPSPGYCGPVPNQEMDGNQLEVVCGISRGTELANP